MKSLLLRYLYCFVLLLFVFKHSSLAQTNTGMATGNYAGISGLWMNPASIVDSRYKFDINIIGLNSYYNNNYLLIRNGTIARRLLYSAPYNSSFADVKMDLLEEGTVNGRVFARTENNIQLPLSFLITTGKKSAIAFNMVNKTVNNVKGLNAETAKMFYDELNNPSLFNKPMNNDSLRYNFLNWQEIGFTYGRVLIGKGNIFLKAAVTGKWLGAGAGGFIQTDKATVTFNNATTMSLNSPLIRYGRTETADLNTFARKNLFTNLADESWGFDAGIVLEWRANIKKFKYVTEDEKELLRRDKNKYLLRFGLAVVDVGEFTLTRKALTKNHTSNFNNWNFANLSASSLSSFDTAYSQQVSFITGQSDEFTYRLPASAIINADLHLLGGFYVNIAAKRPLSGYGDKATTYLPTESWTVITPRFETKFLGIYTPVTRMNNQTFVGGTVKFGPFYAGSSNLAEILSNPKSMRADFHVGMRFSILQGKPPKILKSIKRITDESETAVKQKQGPVTIIINNPDGTSQVVRNDGDTVIIQNKPVQPAGSNPAKIKKQDTKTPQQTGAVYDSATNYLMRELALKELELKRLKEEQQLQNGKKKKSKKGKASKPTSSEEELNKELEKIKKQMALQNAALITTAAVVANTNQNKNVDSTNAPIVPDSSGISLTGADSSVTETISQPAAEVKVEKDTVFVVIAEKKNETQLKEKEEPLPVFNPVFFESSKITIGYSEVNRIKRLADVLKSNPAYIVQLTGCADATGTETANQKISLARANTIRELLLKNQIESTRIEMRTQLIPGDGKPAADARRVDILLKKEVVE
jgi:outer membrane protein OmpA-like peptidoglycan-associated protein